MNDYSQYGEGKLINAYFTKVGTLISLGENDGKTLSNVLGLIESGWKAYLVEPSKEAFGKMKELHKDNNKVKCFNYAIGNTNGIVKFFESGTHLKQGDTALLSTMKATEITRWKQETFTEVDVECKTFLEFKKDARFKQVDLISIDCEGMDFDILQQIDLNALKVKMVIIEHNSVNENKFKEHMIDLGYKVYFRNGCNLIFTK